MNRTWLGAKRRQAIRYGTYNVEHGHPVDKHVAMILKRFKDQRLGVLAITEAADYVHALKTAAAHLGHSLVWDDSTEATRSQALLVRKGLSFGQVHTIDMPMDYHAPNGDVRHSCPPLVATVEGVRFIVVHAPVGAWMLARDGRHTLTGPQARTAAYADYMARVEHFVHEHPFKPTVILGDWNCSNKEAGPGSPDALRRAIAGKFAWPTRNTGHGRIQGAIGRHCTLSRITAHANPVGLPHSDHLLITGQVTITTKAK